MIKLIKFPEIDQFRTIVQNVRNRASYIGKDENGNPIYDPLLPKPTITFKGSVKLHGTNVGINYNRADGLWVQSRENVIGGSTGKDNAGSAFYIESHNEQFVKLFEMLAEQNEIDLAVYTVSIYGEWVGQGIQSKVAISNLPKSLFLFRYAKVSNLADAEFTAYWVDASMLKCPEIRVYNVTDYKQFEIAIDFNQPELVQNAIIDMTISVENECPVASQFGFNGIGEGIVFEAMVDGVRYVFKSKGEKHSKGSKVKTLKPVDNEAIQNKMNCADQVTPEWRLEQMLEKACDFMNGGQLDRKHMGNFIRYVLEDIRKEDSDIVLQYGLMMEDINKFVSDICRNYFFEQEKLK